jgi:hypothetical protein
MLSRCTIPEQAVKSSLRDTEDESSDAPEAGLDCVIAMHGGFTGSEVSAELVRRCSCLFSACTTIEAACRKGRQHGRDWTSSQKKQLADNTKNCSPPVACWQLPFSSVVTEP